MHHGLTASLELLYVVIGLGSVTCVGYFVFQVNAYLGLRHAAQAAIREAELTAASTDDARRAMAVANVLALSAASTLLFLLSGGVTVFQ